jgi:hypothetical protein
MGILASRPVVGKSMTAYCRMTAYPRCRLNGNPLVFRLPEGCPHADEFPHQVLSSMQDEAWARIMEMDFAGLDLMERYDACVACRLTPELRARLRHRAPTAAHRQQASREPVSAQQAR